MDIFLYYKNALKKLKKETEKKSRILGWAFVIGGGDIKKEKIISNWGIFLLFFSSHVYSNHSLNLIIL